MKGRITVGLVIAILLISTALYLWTKDAVSFPYTIHDVKMLGQMILSVSKVNLVEAGNYNLPWSGKTWLVTLVVNPQEAESVIAKLGYLEDTVPKEEIASNGAQAQYDLKIRIVPKTQQCIYGPDFSTMMTWAPVRAFYKEWDLGSGLTCPHADDYGNYAKQYKQELENSGYSGVGYSCTYYCGGVPKHAYLTCDFIATKSGSNVGIAKLTLKSLYVEDRLSVTAGYKTAEGETRDTIKLGSSNPSAILTYGTTPVGKVDLVGYLKASDFCPEGANYYLYNAGNGWKVIPETTYEKFQYLVEPLLNGKLNLPECTNIGSYDDFYKCKKAMEEYVDNINNYINVFNDSTPVISGKTASRPSAEEYSASYFFAIQPDNPVVYSMYRMYLKASWIGILVSMAKPTITNVSPKTITLTGPESKSISITVKNNGDEGGIILKVICSNDFLVDGKSTSTRADTLPKGGYRTYTFNISYGGSGRKPASTTCTAEVQSSSNPLIKSSSTFSVVFKPKGVYPPNTTVCTTSKTYAKTDNYGNIIPGTEKTCGEGTYCEQTDSGAVCKEEQITPTPTPSPATGGTNYLLYGLVGIMMFMAIIIAIIA